ncbi:MAG: iron ABC transporter permease [Thermodesulfobacteriota bacterium]|nr:iron ABC transporter permease [Thermodesulfobacteriota bacterium]
MLLFSFVLFGIILVSASMGYVKIGFSDILRIVASEISGNATLANGISETFRVIVMEVRLPRILACAAVGGSLAVSGVLFQGILLNPLADPYTLGVSAGAAFGACIAILLSLGAAIVSVPLFAFAGACLTLLFVIYLSYTGKNSSASLSSNTLILSGIIVGAILSAGISFLKYTADEQVAVIIFWLMGSFASKTWFDVVLTLLFLGGGFVTAMFFARDLNLVSLGERSATSLGVDTRKVTLILLVTGSLLAAISVSVSGIIGFVGLLVPHMVRFVTGPDNRKLVPVSMLVGASLLLCADTITRAVLPHEIPIGVLTAIIGGPIFCWIFKKGHTA